MKSVAISVFKAQCLALLEDVARTGKPLLVTKRGKPLARVTSDGHGTSSYPQETLRGTVETLGDVIAPAVAPDAWNAARGILLTQDAPHVARKRPRRRNGRRARP